MTKDEFEMIFRDLQKSYGAKFTSGQIKSFFLELERHDSRDFSAAVQRIPANEVRGFPQAKVIQNYILDAQASRRMHVQRQQPENISQAIYASANTGNRHPSETSFGHLVAKMIHVGIFTDRATLIRRFQSEHDDWLLTHTESREWLMVKLSEVSTPSLPPVSQAIVPVDEPVVAF